MADKETKIRLTASDETRAAFASANATIEKYTGGLVNLNTLLSGATVAAFGAVIKSSIDTSDALGKSAQKIGTSTEALSRLKYAADLSDVSFEGLEKGLTKLSKSAYDAAANGGASAQAWDKMGISVKDAGGQLKDSTVLMSEVAEQFAVMKDGSAKTALAISLFGKSGADMIPLLNEGSDGLKKMGDEADALGLTLSGSTTDAAQQFNDNLTRMKAASSGAANQLTAAVLPALNVVAEAFVGTAKDGKVLAVVADTLRISLETVAVVVAEGVYMFRAIGAEIGGVMAKMNALANLDFKGIHTINDMVREDIALARKEVDEFQKRVLNPPTPAVVARRTGAAPVIENDAEIKAADDKAAKLEEAARKAEEKRLAAAEAAYKKQDDTLTAAAHSRFAALREAAVYEDATELERAQNKQAQELADLEIQRMMLASSHELSLSELAQFEQAKADIIAVNAKNITSIEITEYERQKKEKLDKEKRNYETTMLFLGTTKGLMNSHSRAAFEIGKAAAISETVINTYAAATGAYKAMASIPFVGPALGIAAAAGAIASGMAQVSAIRSTSFGGAGGAASYGGASSTLNGGQPTTGYPSTPAQAEAPKQSTVVTINMGDAAFLPASAVRDLIKQINEQIADGATIAVS